MCKAECVRLETDELWVKVLRKIRFPPLPLSWPISNVHTKYLSKCLTHFFLINLNLWGLKLSSHGCHWLFDVFGLRQHRHHMFSLTLHALISWPMFRSFTSQAMVFLGISHVIASLSFSHRRPMVMSFINQLEDRDLTM